MVKFTVKRPETSSRFGALLRFCMIQMILSHMIILYIFGIVASVGFFDVISKLITFKVIRKR